MDGVIDRNGTPWPGPPTIGAGLDIIPKGDGTGYVLQAGAAGGAVAGHAAATTGVHGIADTAQLETQAGALAKAEAAITDHVGAIDPHEQYTTLAEVVSALFNAALPVGGLMSEGVSIGIFEDDGSVGLRLYEASTGTEWRIVAAGGVLTISTGTAVYTFFDDGTFTLSGDFSAAVVNADQFNLGGVAVMDSVNRTLGGLTLANVSYPRATKTAAYTLTNNDFIVDADAAGGAFTVTLPTAVGRSGRMFRVTRVNAGANNVTVGTSASQTINGAATRLLATQYASVLLYSDGSNWVAV